ncbi:MAG TPA: dihydroneopterin aldolase [Actinomycetes bacterium]|nr:dihydroneopterin aldolase [Actinomycetes bacterium]
MSDRVALTGLRAQGRHGWFAHETANGQEFVVDVVLHVDTRPAAASDDLADAVDYASVAEAVVGVVEGPPVRLIETLAQRVADVCLADPRVGAVEVVVHKPQAPLDVAFGDVEVRILRERG